MRSASSVTAFSLLAPALLVAGSAWASLAPSPVTQIGHDASSRTQIAATSNERRNSRDGGSRKPRYRENFDPYGKDDPTGPKWGSTNRYGLGNRIREKNTDDDRERRDERDRRATGDGRPGEDE